MMTIIAETSLTSYFRYRTLIARSPQWIPAGIGDKPSFLTISNLPLTHQNQTAVRMILNTVRAYLFSAVLHFPRNICHHRPIPGKYIPHTVQV